MATDERRDERMTRTAWDTDEQEQGARVALALRGEQEWTEVAIDMRGRRAGRLTPDDRALHMARERAAHFVLIDQLGTVLVAEQAQTLFPAAEDSAACHGYPKIHECSCAASDVRDCAALAR